MEDNSIAQVIVSVTDQPLDKHKLDAAVAVFRAAFDRHKQPSVDEEKDLDYLKLTGELIAGQENRATQYPLYAIQVDYKDYVNYLSDWEFRERNIWDGMDEDEFCSHLCGPCKDAYIGSDYTEIPDECPTDDCGTEAYRYYNVEQKLDVEQVGVFLTLASCEAHIMANKHHYNNPSAYAIAAWRNPEMVAVMQHLIKLSGKEVPSHYR